jgi:N-acetylmuramoyl-L-alanine amidase
LLLALLPSLAPARAAGKKAGRRAVSAWEDAEQTRERLEAIPAEARTRADYEAALDKFRAIYHEDPADVHAPASVYMVAELLAERGRGAHDAKSLKAAVGQYEFLRTQYPASSLRVQALLAEAQIERNDLGDATAAKERYELLVKQAPRSNEAEEARAALGQMSGQSTNQPSRSAKPAEAQPRSKPVETAAVAASGTPQPQTVDTPAAAKAETPQRSGELALVTGIRHWSTPNYTRVVIDLGDNVTYEAARVPDPDRIYFDLHGTRLAPELVNKIFAVTDDGFLKRIRAAQFRDHMSRVVLDVNDVTEYSAFLLPNPYRLIIDVHGRAAAGSRPAPAALPAEAR